MSEYVNGIGAVIPRSCDTPVEPLRRATHYSGEPGCTARARTFTEGFLAQLRHEWCVPVDARCAGEVMLVVSELVTNAERHSPGPYVLDLEGTDRHVTVTVYDSSATEPLRHPRDPARIGGHGLEIVDALAELTVERVPVGKRVRAVLAVRA
ncbi:ATP-binding protein [Streptomyces beihaiensis]|uniref:ATP-binding protein n=1 Tax=Streptomyces beihaiensis TaxID=2984495 RepID=A0ABT3U189_9ACTN|nr:ATP-binding protein [Streptomyces beihaiensis]MCX3063082.1 ATP-binding protein [Streptomyces beihaiensis]